MAERPFIARAHEVRAILAGRQTQFRRVIRPQPSRIGMLGPIVAERTVHCPYGHGDRLWVRESFWAKHDTDSDGYRTIDCGPCLDLGPDFHPGIEYCATPECLNPPTPIERQRVERWTGEPAPGDWWLSPPEKYDGESDYTADGKWVFLPWGEPGLGPFSKHPSIHMPRWASRITLEVTGVRVERLQAITEEDARAEGVAPCGGFMATSGCWTNYGSNGPSFNTARESFASLWRSINGPESWDANPWVWVVSFRRVQP